VVRKRVLGKLARMLVVVEVVHILLRVLHMLGLGKLVLRKPVERMLVVEVVHTL